MLSPARRSQAKPSKSGWGGIRTPGGISPTAVFKTANLPQETQGEKGVSDDAGAVETKTMHFEPDLQAVIDRWQDLPEAIKTGILAMVRTAETGAKNRRG